MVGGEDDDRVVKLAGGFQRVDHLADEVVDIGDVGVIAMARGAEIGLGHGVVVHGRDIIEALAVGIELSRGPCAARAGRSMSSSR